METKSKNYVLEIFFAVLLPFLVVVLTIEYTHYRNNGEIRQDGVYFDFKNSEYNSKINGLSTYSGLIINHSKLHLNSIKFKIKTQKLITKFFYSSELIGKVMVDPVVGNSDSTIFYTEISIKEYNLPPDKEVFLLFCTEENNVYEIIEEQSYSNTNFSGSTISSFVSPDVSINFDFSLFFVLLLSFIIIILVIYLIKNYISHLRKVSELNVKISQLELDHKTEVT